MKELHGSATTTVAAVPEDCFALLSDLEGYPRWYPDGVRGVRVLERDPDGLARRAEATLRVATGPLARDFSLLLEVSMRRPSAVGLERVPHDDNDEERFAVTWRIHPGSETRLELALDAELSVPRLVPVGGMADSMARGFVEAAAQALRPRGGAGAG